MTIRQYFAQRRLAKLVRKMRESYECERFRRRRAAAKLGLQRRLARMG